MARITIVLFLTIYLSLNDVASNPVKDASYIEGINFLYEKDKLICGDVECPADTFGCKIIIKTNEDDRQILYQTFNCLSRDKTVILGAGDRIELLEPKIIDIDLETYIGALSVYSTGYGLGGHENAKGVVAVDQLYNLKETAKLTKKIAVASSNA